MPREGPKTGTKRVPKQANLTSRNRTQFHKIPAKPQVPNIPEATRDPAGAERSDGLAHDARPGGRWPCGDRVRPTGRSAATRSAAGACTAARRLRAGRRAAPAAAGHVGNRRARRAGGHEGSPGSGSQTQRAVRRRRVAGASFVRPAVEPIDAVAWIRRNDADLWGERLAATPSRPAPGRVTMQMSRDPFVLSLASNRNGIQVADPVQLYLDSRSAGERALEAADAIRAEMGW